MMDLHLEHLTGILTRSMQMIQGYFVSNGFISLWDSNFYNSIIDFIYFLNEL
jgi:hypothetical protein